MGGGVPVPIVLELDPEAKTSAGYVLNMDVVRSKITEKTKMMVINKLVWLFAIFCHDFSHSQKSK
jgi:aspartate/methionine/tyrosine aminotransferase